MRIKEAIKGATMGDKPSMDAARKKMKKVDFAEMEMRIAQAATVPQIRTDNPVEFGLIAEEMKRRERWHNVKLALISAAIGGASGSVVTHFFN